SCSPGVSTKAICARGRVTTPRIRDRVVCGLGETIATFCWTSLLRSVDLPTLGLPTMAAKPARCAPPASFKGSFRRGRSRRAAARVGPFLAAHGEPDEVGDGLRRLLLEQAAGDASSARLEDREQVALPLRNAARLVGHFLVL